MGILLASLLLQPSESGLSLFGFKWPLHCPLYDTFGIKCALCGLTRSFCVLTHSHFAQAFRLHFLGPLIFAFILFQIPYRISTITIRPRKMNIKLIKISSTIALALSAATFINWLVYLGGLVL